MQTTNRISVYLRPGCTAALALTLLAGCGSLVPTASPPPPSFYSLDNVRAAVRANMPAAAVPQMQRDAPTLIVNPPHAAAGFDSPRMIFVREQHRLEYFAHSEWIDPPARMLAPLLVAALEDSGAFRAVVLTPSAAVGDVRLDTEIIRLQHEFGAPASSSNPASRVRFTLRAYLVDVKLRTVLARREFDAVIPAASDDPYGGVVAANAAVQSVLQQLAFFCAEAVKEKTP